MALGMVRVYKLLDNAKSVKEIKFPIDEGIVPVIWAPTVFKVTRAVKDPIEYGRYPWIGAPISVGDNDNFVTCPPLQVIPGHVQRLLSGYGPLQLHPLPSATHHIFVV